LCVDLKRCPPVGFPDAKRTSRQRQQDIPQIIFNSCQKLKISRFAKGDATRTEIEWIHQDWREEVERLDSEHGEIESIARPKFEEIIPSPEREPIDCFYCALEIYPRDRIPEYWAMLQHNLGLA
jgi:hypothetical protein